MDTKYHIVKKNLLAAEIEGQRGTEEEITELLKNKSMFAWVYKSMDEYANLDDPGVNLERARTKPCYKKTGFADQKQAEFYIKKLKQTSTRSVKPVRSYLCPHCLLWHLTSKIKEEHDKTKELLAKYKTDLHLKNKEIQQIHETHKKKLKAKNVEIGNLNFENARLKEQLKKLKK